MEIDKADEKKLKFYRKYVGAGAVRKSLIIMILWLLSKEKMHGYKLIEVLQNNCHMKGAGASMVYPILKKLEKDRFIGSKKVKQGKRIKKEYCITKMGTEMINFSKKMISRSKLIKQFFKEMSS